MAEKSGGDAALIADLVDELEHRQTARAKKLLATLTGDTGKRAPNRQGARHVRQDKNRTTTKETQEAHRETSAVTTAPDTALRTQDEAYRVLRETFTEESERLAKWGMTSAMPSSLRRMVFREWKKLVSETTDEFGRSSSQLMLDSNMLSEPDATTQE